MTNVYVLLFSSLALFIDLIYRILSWLEKSASILYTNLIWFAEISRADIDFHLRL